MDVLKLALASFAVTWFLSFWHKLEPWRERLGIVFRVYEWGEDREDSGGLGAWINCPMCTVLLSFPIPVLLWWLWQDGLTGLAGIGLALLFVRWYESLRPKARWWV